MELHVFSWVNALFHYSTGSKLSVSLPNQKCFHLNNKESKNFESHQARNLEPHPGEGELWYLCSRNVHFYWEIYG